jgi:hypothetical protein
MDGYNLVSFAGIFILAGVAWALSACVAGTFFTEGSILLGGS